MPIDPPSRPAATILLLGLLVGPGVACKAGTEPRPPSAFQLGIAVAPSATAQSGLPLPTQPVIALEDAQSQAFAQAGRTITAALTTPGGTLTGILSLKTDAAGRAAFGNLVISGPVGPWTLRFDSPGLRSVTTDPIQLGAGVPAMLAAVSGSLQTSVAGTPVAIAPTVRVSDAVGNAIAGVAVQFVASAGRSVDGGSAVTDANGIAAPLRWTLSIDIGLNTLTATTSAVPGASVTFTATGTVGPPATLTPVTGGGQSATVGGSVAIAPAVKLADAAGHLLPGVVISFAVGVGGGSVTPANSLTGPDGIATAGGWSLGLPPGDNTLIASRSGVPPVTFHATGRRFPGAGARRWRIALLCAGSRRPGLLLGLQRGRPARHRHRRGARLGGEAGEWRAGVRLHRCRRGPYLRPSRQRRRLLLGRERRGTTRGWQHDPSHHPDPRHRRPQVFGPRAGRGNHLWPGHERHRGVLGVRPAGTARRRGNLQPAGSHPHSRRPPVRRAQHGTKPQLRAQGGWDALLLGRERRRPVGRRHHNRADLSDRGERGDQLYVGFRRERSRADSGSGRSRLHLRARRLGAHLRARDLGRSVLLVGTIPAEWETGRLLRD